ncbi:MAG: Alpha/beta hydrolase fold protein, partial [Candidatus Wolfebacteria bacterium GW2011_GWB1_41_12]
KENYYAQINGSGNITSWTKSGFDYPFGYCCGAAVEANGYLYVIGGYLTPGGYTNKVYKSQLNIVLPTPTPTPTPAIPTIILPGMGASWNYEAMVHSRTDIPDTEWKIAPFITLYNGIINALGSDLLVYPYDWRRNIGDTANNLASFVDGQVPSGKVNLVGHSMGGLVARAYAQNHPDRVNKLVTVGSPYQGSVNVYRIWEGADFSDMPYWMSLSSRLLLRINRGNYANEVAEVQALFPSIRNIWPTFDFTNRPRTWSNNFLPLTYTDKLITIVGSGFDTLEYLKVTSRTAAEAALNKWVDGKPVENQYADGDDTVLKNGGDITIAGASHGQLVGETAGQQAIIDSLSIVATPQASSQNDLRNIVLVTAASPVNISVTDAGGNSYTSEDGLVVINNPTNGTYTVTAEAVGGGGNYDIYFGKIKGDDEAWEEVSDSVGSGESDQYQFNVDLTIDDLGSNPITAAVGRMDMAITDVKASSLGRVSKNLLAQELARIKGYVLDINKSSVKTVSAFDSRMLRLIKTVESLVKRLDSSLWSGLTAEQKSQIKESLRLVVADVDQAREDKFVN